MSKRVTQLVQEAIRLPDSVNPKRVTFEVVEIVRQPSSRYARATQCVIEVLRKNESEIAQRQPVVVVVC